MRKILSKKELSEIKYQDTDEWLAKGNEITVLKPYKPEIKAYFGRNKKAYNPKRGVMK